MIWAFSTLLCPATRTHTKSKPCNRPSMATSRVKKWKISSEIRHVSRSKRQTLLREPKLLKSEVCASTRSCNPLRVNECRGWINWLMQWQAARLVLQLPIKVLLDFYIARCSWARRQPNRWIVLKDCQWTIQVLHLASDSLPRSACSQLCATMCHNRLICEMWPSEEPSLCVALALVDSSNSHSLSSTSGTITIM